MVEPPPSLQAAVKPDYSVLATLTVDGLKLRRIPCGVYLPLRIEDKPLLHFEFSPTQLASITATLSFPSFHARASYSGGGLAVTLDAAKVHFSSFEPLTIGPRTVGYQAMGKPQNLLVRRRLSGGLAGKKRCSISWWVSNNPLLSPMRMSISSYDGTHRMKRLGRKERFTLAKGAAITFDRHYLSQKDGDEWRQWSHLVAECSPRSPWKNAQEAANALLPMVDDFLLLASFGSRRLTTWLGWSTTDMGQSVAFYRGDYTFPKERKNRGPHEELISHGYLATFLRQAYPRLRKHHDPESLRNAFYTLLPERRLPIEWEFITAFSALEGLLLNFRRQEGLELIVASSSQWRAISQELRTVLKAQTRDALSKLRRGWIYSKVDELNRVPLTAVFEEFCKKYSIPTEDLWPFSDTHPKVGLIEIRNKLVHGEFKVVHDIDPLWLAGQHLRWTLERMLLSVLGWPTEKSTVSREQLAELPGLYKDVWKEKARFEERHAPGIS